MLYYSGLADMSRSASRVSSKKLRDRDAGPERRVYARVCIYVYVYIYIYIYMHIHIYNIYIY